MPSRLRRPPLWRPLIARAGPSVHAGIGRFEGVLQALAAPAGLLVRRSPGSALSAPSGPAPSTPPPGLGPFRRSARASPSRSFAPSALRAGRILLRRPAPPEPSRPPELHGAPTATALLPRQASAPASSTYGKYDSGAGASPSLPQGHRRRDAPPSLRSVGHSEGPKHSPRAPSSVGGVARRRGSPSKALSHLGKGQVLYCDIPDRVNWILTRSPFVSRLTYREASPDADLS